MARQIESWRDVCRLDPRWLTVSVKRQDLAGSADLASVFDRKSGNDVLCRLTSFCYARPIRLE